MRVNFQASNCLYWIPKPNRNGDLAEKIKLWNRTRKRFDWIVLRFFFLKNSTAMKLLQSFFLLKHQTRYTCKSFDENLLLTSYYEAFQKQINQIHKPRNASKDRLNEFVMSLITNMRDNVKKAFSFPDGWNKLSPLFISETYLQCRVHVSRNNWRETFSTKRITNCSRKQQRCSR